MSGNHYNYELNAWAKEVQSEILNDGNVLFLPVASDNWQHPTKGKNAVILSPDNSKVKRGVKTYANLHAQKYQDAFFAGIDTRFIKIVSFGKPCITSCPFAGSCIEYCYGHKTEKCRQFSMGTHAHNYLMVFAQSVETIKERIQNGIDNVRSSVTKRVVIRMGDAGDITTQNEMNAWYQIAVENDDVLVYGYTKSTPYYYNLLVANDGQLVDNFRLNISQTDNEDSIKFAEKIKAEFPKYYRFCHIWDKIEDYNPDIPFNNEEEKALAPNTREYAIAIHGTDFAKESPYFLPNKFYAQLGKDLGVKVC